MSHLVGILSTRFEDPTLEREYAKTRFTNAYPLVVAYCVGISLLTACHAIASR